MPWDENRMRWNVHDQLTLGFWDFYKSDLANRNPEQGLDICGESNDVIIKCKIMPLLFLFLPRVYFITNYYSHFNYGVYRQNAGCYHKLFYRFGSYIS